ncbi:MAG TPA: ferritin [Candidatus Gastranaerophilaceae bacterium]|nr:ferritin [Candidatus Gastranaerophilaceae bacterium]
MINKEVAKVLIEQVNKEFYSAYLYLSMSAHFSDIGLLGFANWMRVQAQEEQAHAMLIYDFLVDRGEKVILTAIDTPPNTWKTTLKVMEEVLKHEIYVTGLINNIVTVAEKHKDRATMSYMNWFVDEQVEEEANAQDIIAKLKLMGDDKSALYLLDKDLSTRVFVQPMIKGGASA